MKIGIDAGGTLTKIVYLTDEGRTFEYVKSSHIDHLIKTLNETYSNAEIYITGGKAAYMSARLNCSCHTSIEFDATYRGLKMLLKEQSCDLDTFVYMNVGTGTSFHRADQYTQTRLGGTGVGGGTLIGLSTLLTGISEYDEIIQSAKDGTRDLIDLKVHHIYAGKPSPIPGDLTASNFGNVLNNINELSTPDKLQAVIGLVAETVVSIGVNLAESHDTSHIVFIGTTIKDNDVMKEIIQRYASLKGVEPMIINNGEFSGALGAIGYDEK